MATVDKLKLLCLCPTYGRRPELLKQSLSCFLTQDYQHKKLLLFDDLGTLMGTRVPYNDVLILSTKKRADSIAHKYRRMLSACSDIAYDAVVVWDDDDGYFPWHLSAHAAVLANHGWSKPSKIWSAYHVPPKLEDASGRFHGSIAIRRDLLEKIRGWVQTKRADFDQQMLARLNQEEPPGDPCLISSPSYLYRWQTTQSGHCSGLMSSPDNEDWYDRYQPDSTEPIEELIVE